MEYFDTVIVGAGQAGLAVSYYLTQQNREHVLLERQRIGEAWRSAKWDSFTLVTPNWMLQLPGFIYKFDHPDGFLTRDEVVQYLDNYVDQFDLPVRTGVEVTAVEGTDSGARFRLETNIGPFAASNVVIATGTFQKPKIPAFSSQLASHLHQIHSSEYRNPDELPPGAVLVVGGGQSGCQIAEELNQHGRRVYLCTGSAARMPRRYRGRDSFWWAEKLGLFDQTVADLPSPQARFAANPQVTGKDGGRTLSLHQLVIDGVTLLGRMQDASGAQVSLADDLTDNLAQADKFSADFKKGVDKYIAATGMQAPEEAQPELRAGYDSEVITHLDLDRAGITSVIWATGYTFDYAWVKFPVCDEGGYPVTQRGVTDHPGLYFIGLHWLHTRRSGLLSGVGDDAANVAEHIANHS